MAKQENEGKIGGLAFFFSLFFLIILSAIGTLFLIYRIRGDFFSTLLVLIATGALGFIFAYTAIKSRLQVYIHELKHSIVANLAGNRAKALKVRSRYGSFEYEYTKKTAAYNAFIVLAPYFFPIFTIVAFLIALGFYCTNINSFPPIVFPALLGFSLGADLALHVKETHYHQTDIHAIRGGILVSLAYILASNLTLIQIVMIGTMLGWKGFVSYFELLFRLTLNLLFLWK